VGAGQLAFSNAEFYLFRCFFVHRYWCWSVIQWTVGVIQYDHSGSRAFPVAAARL